MDLGDRKTVYTPEQVAITYRLAGLGTRFAALLLDTCLQGLLLGLGLLAVFLISAGLLTSLGQLFDGDSDAPMWVVGLMLLAVFVCYWGYFIFWETVWNGQTPGKRLCGIRVLRDGGFPIDFRAAFIRNIVRVVDSLPGPYGVGVLSAFASKESKRLGDYAAGTIVVVEGSRPVMKAPPAAAAPVPYYLLGDPALLNLRAISREQFAVVERFLARQAELPPAVRADLARQIAVPLMSVIGFPPPTGEFHYDRFLAELAVAYRALASV